MARLQNTYVTKTNGNSGVFKQFYNKEKCLNYDPLSKSRAIKTFLKIKKSYFDEKFNKNGIRLSNLIAVLKDLPFFFVYNDYPHSFGMIGLLNRATMYEFEKMINHLANDKLFEKYGKVFDVAYEHGSSIVAVTDGAQRCITGRLAPTLKSYEILFNKPNVSNQNIWVFLSDLFVRFKQIEYNVFVLCNKMTQKQENKIDKPPKSQSVTTDESICGQTNVDPSETMIKESPKATPKPSGDTGKGSSTSYNCCIL